MHYTELSLTRNPDYKGSASIWSEDEAAAVMLELIRYFGQGRGLALPDPPEGLPGKTHRDHSDAMDIVHLGFDYFHSVLKGEGRRLHNICEEIEQFERDAYWRGYNKCRAEWEDHELAQIMAANRAAMDAAPSSEPERFVYFIGSETGPVKIGLATNVETRLKGLQTAHPAKLTLLAVTTGGQPQEYAYHKQFASCRLHGEWFERTPDVLAEIERLNALDLAA